MTNPDERILVTEAGDVKGVGSYKLADGRTFEVVYDDEPGSPLGDDPDALQIYHWSSKYDLGRKVERGAFERLGELEEDAKRLGGEVTALQANANSLEYEDECALENKSADLEHIKDEIENLKDLFPDGAITLNLYIYDHSGVAYSLNGFSCPWDSGQVGYLQVGPACVEAYEQQFNECRDPERKKYGLEGYVRGQLADLIREDYTNYSNGLCYLVLLTERDGQTIGHGDLYTTADLQEFVRSEVLAQKNPSLDTAEVDGPSP